MIYLDSAATTQPFLEVVNEVSKLNLELFANSSSIHNFGFQSKKLYEQSKTRVLDLLKLKRDFDILFTSGATEANNLVLKGISEKYKNRGKTILISSIEHPSIKSTAKSLLNLGFLVKEIPVDELGMIKINALESLLTSDVILVSIITINNEMGVIQDFKRISSLIRKYPKIIFHTDATQAIAKEPIDYSLFDLISFSGHKFHSTKGVGALIFRKNISFTPLIEGGAQQNNNRAGTIDVPSIAGMAKALELSLKERDSNLNRIKEFHDYLINELSKIDEVSINSNPKCSNFIINFSLRKHKASVIVEGLSEKQIYVSSISACSSKKENTSEVLLALGKSKADADNSIRVSFSYSTTLDEINIFLSELKRLLVEVKER
ncbi:MAG: cysteine desulfurase family protein [Bacilli bacterium]|nr:cysteine desulfurase family protein [Bacilli bacterium]MDY6430925.1 cysteine desulfurase family protein [Bacilli bacterium]